MFRVMNEKKKNERRRKRRRTKRRMRCTNLSKQFSKDLNWKELGEPVMLHVLIMTLIQQHTHTMPCSPSVLRRVSLSCLLMYQITTAGSGSAYVQVSGNRILSRLFHDLTSERVHSLKRFTASPLSAVLFFSSGVSVPEIGMQCVFVRIWELVG